MRVMAQGGGHPGRRIMGMGALLAVVWAGWIGTAGAEEAVTKSHAITTFGDPPKYAADFAHLDYVNPTRRRGAISR